MIAIYTLLYISRKIGKTKEKERYKQQITKYQYLIFTIFISFFLFFPQLPAIDDILPQDIRTGSNRRQRIEIGMCHPNSQNRILLPQCLTATDTVIIDRADSLSQKNCKQQAIKAPTAIIISVKTIRRIVQ